MVTRLFDWLFHRHEWAEKERLTFNSDSGRGVGFVQYCAKCQKYRKQKVVFAITMMDM